MVESAGSITATSGKAVDSLKVVEVMMTRDNRGKIELRMAGGEWADDRGTMTVCES